MHTEKISHELGWRLARSTNRSHFRISVRDTARQLHGCSRAVLQWAEPSDAALLGAEPIGRALQGGQDALQVDLLRHSGSVAAKRARLAAAHLSGDVDCIQRAEMRFERNQQRTLWRRDPRDPGRTIMLTSSDEATCRAWAAGQGVQLDVLDGELPAFADACRWTWARASRGLISDDDVTAKLARLRSRITEKSRAFDHSG